MIFIAEIGMNHNGNWDLAYELIKQAKFSGADIAKFQLGWRDGKGEINRIDLDILQMLKKWCDYFEIEFMADAAEYFIWIRGKCDGNTGTDALWFQFDDQIGTLKHTADKDAPGRGLGNWRDHFDAGVYKWGSQEVPPPTVVTVKFNKKGLHKVRVQPRQVPHNIDQILLSQDQDERPEDDPMDADIGKDPSAVEKEGKLGATWGALKEVW